VRESRTKTEHDLRVVLCAPRGRRSRKEPNELQPVGDKVSPKVAGPACDNRSRTTPRNARGAKAPQVAQPIRAATDTNHPTDEEESHATANPELCQSCLRPAEVEDPYSVVRPFVRTKQVTQYNHESRIPNTPFYGGTGIGKDIETDAMSGQDITAGSPYHYIRIGDGNDKEKSPILERLVTAGLSNATVARGSAIIDEATDWRKSVQYALRTVIEESWTNLRFILPTNTPQPSTLGIWSRNDPDRLRHVPEQEWPRFSRRMQERY